MSDADNRNLIVVGPGCRKVRQGIKVQQRQSLRADQAFGNRDTRRHVAFTLRESGHQRGADSVVAVARPLISDENIWTISDQMRNSHGAAERGYSGEMVVSRPGSVLTRQRKRTRVQRGIVHVDAEAAVVQRSRPVAVVAERREQRKGRTCAVIHAAVDQEAIVSAFVPARLCFAHGRARFRFLMLGRGGLWRRDWRGRSGLCFSMNLIERQHFQLPVCRLRVRAGRNIGIDSGKAEHLHLDRPDAVREIRKRIRALRIGDRRYLPLALSRGNRGARNGQAPKRYLTVLLGREKLNDNQPGCDKRPKEAANHQVVL